MRKNEKCILVRMICKCMMRTTRARRRLTETRLRRLIRQVIVEADMKPTKWQATPGEEYSRHPKWDGPVEAEDGTVYEYVIEKERDGWYVDILGNGRPVIELDSPEPTERDAMELGRSYVWEFATGQHG